MLPGTHYNVIRISAFDSPNFTGEDVPDLLNELLVSKTWVEERRSKWGESSPLWISKVTGEFPKTSADGIIPLNALTQALECNLELIGANELEHFQEKCGRFSARKMLKNKEIEPIR